MFTVETYASEFDPPVSLYGARDVDYHEGGIDGKDVFHILTNSIQK